jgi:hypothetical protein
VVDQVHEVRIADQRNAVLGGLVTLALLGRGLIADHQ